MKVLLRKILTELRVIRSELQQLRALMEGWAKPQTYITYPYPKDNTTWTPTVEITSVDVGSTDES